ncbi:MAG: deoxyribonuclease IV [Myxococcota bacterium]
MGETSTLRPAIHVDPPLARIAAVLEERGVDAFQTTLRDPKRFGKTGIPDEADQEAYLDQVRSTERPPWGLVHGSLLVNLASPEGRIRNSSLSSILGDLELAGHLGLEGVCFHPGYAKGHTSTEAAIAAARRKLGQLLERAKGPARALVENCCEGSELGQTLEEMAQLIDDLDAPPERLGMVLDTCHLHAAGFDLAAPDAADRLAGELEERNLLGRLAAFHLNDSEGEVGCHRDRHAVPGEGTIGEGLRHIVWHPAFLGLPLVLEVSLEGASRGIGYLTS